MTQDILFCVAAMAAVLALWDLGRRKLASNAQALLKTIFDHTARIMVLEDNDKKFADQLGELRTLGARIDSVYEAVGAAKTDLLSRIAKTEDENRVIRQDADQAALAIKGLWERCDKNTKALENTAENLQRTLNEKFTGAALRGALNQGKPG